MRILMTGGTGFIGKPLTAKLVSLGHRVTVITRRAPGTRETSSEGVDYFAADLYKEPVLPAELIDETDAVINLAGESLAGKRWTNKQKSRIVESRTRTTKALVEAMANAQKKPDVFLSSSAIGYYGGRGDEKLDEQASAGSDFLATTCLQWESEARKAEAPGRRMVLLRTGIVLGKSGGALAKLLLPFKMFVGGPVGSGQQWMSWISLDDLIALIVFALENPKVDGPLNLTAPNPVTNATFSKMLGRVLRRPSFMKVPGFALKMLLGEQALIVLTGQRVLPTKAQQLGFTFRHTELESTLRKLLGSQNV